MKRSFFLISVTWLFSQTAFSQFGKKILDHTKKETEYRINKKIEEKIDKTVDKGVDKADTLLTGKKRKENTKKQPALFDNSTDENSKNQQAADTNNVNIPTANEFARQMNTEWITDILFTNIKCDKGKRNVEKKLSNTAGIKSAQVNVQTGELTIAYYNSNIQYNQIIDIVNQLYFDADGKKAAEGKNVCK